MNQTIKDKNEDFIRNNPLNVWIKSIKDNEYMMELAYEYIYAGDEIIGVWQRYRKPTSKEMAELFNHE